MRGLRTPQPRRDDVTVLGAVDNFCRSGVSGSVRATQDGRGRPEAAGSGTRPQRVLAPGGHLLLVFQVGDGALHMTEALGHKIELEFHRRWPDEVAELLAQAGLPVRTRVLREPEEDERSAQAYLLARKPVGRNRL